MIPIKTSMDHAATVWQQATHLTVLMAAKDGIPQAIAEVQRRGLPFQ